MRVTMKELTKRMQYVISERYYDLAKIQEQLSTGKRILKPSDQPIDTANDLKLKTTIAQDTQFHTNIEDGLSFMNVTDTAMLSMNSIMQRLRELAVQGATDTVSAGDRIAIQKEVDQLFRQLITLTNTNYKGDYIFSGTNSKIAPFPIVQSKADSPADYTKLKMASYDGTLLGVGFPAQLRNAFDNTAMTNILPGSFKLHIGAVEYIEGRDFTIDYENGTITPLVAPLAANVTPGTANYAAAAFKISFDSVSRGRDVFGNTVANTGDVLREIEPDVTMAINIAGDELIQNAQAGIDMMGTMVRFGQSLLSNNRAGVTTAIGEIDKTFQAILNAQSKNGAKTNRFETTLSRNEQQTTEATGLSSNLEDVDMADAATKFSLMQTVYNAALKSAAMTMQHSLVDYL
jgi:flagellar hook-associated protein 3 FlgL